MLTPAECVSFSSIPGALNNLEACMVITLTQNIHKHEKCNIDMPLAQPFMGFILQNAVIVLFFILKCYF